MVDTMGLSGFESIPREILEQILDYLDQWTVPERNFRVQPNPQIFTTTSGAIVSLKSLSLVSRSCYHAIAPRLFRHVRIIHLLSSHAAIGVQTEPFNWVGVISDLASFLDRRGLGSCVQSLTLRVEGSYPAYYYEQSPSILEDQWVLHIEKQWHNLLQLISGSLRRLTILASPYCLGMLLSIKLDSYIDEALYMPYHLLILEKSGLSSIAQDSKVAKLGIHSSSSILTDIKWTSMLLNEGSFLRYHADSVGNWQGELLSTHQIDGEPCFPLSFRQSIRSIEYITAFPAYEHMISWMRVLKSMSNLEKVSFQTIPIQDLDPDPTQRGSAHFWLLENNRDAVYIAIFTKMIKNLINERSSLDQIPFQRLRIIECTDMPGREHFSAWRRAAQEAEEYGWEWQQYEEDLKQAHSYPYRDRLVKKHRVRSDIPTRIP